MSDQTYTQQDVIHQCLVAFGQGTNFMRVSSRACREFVRLMQISESQHAMHRTWGTDAVQLLERVRAIGRLAAALAVDQGTTVIEAEVVQRGFRKVRLVSKTGWCGNGEGEGEGSGSGGTVTTADRDP